MGPSNFFLQECMFLDSHYDLYYKGTAEKTPKGGDEIWIRYMIGVKLESLR